MQSISMPLRRGLALALLLTVIVLGWTLAIQPLVDLSRDRRDDIAALSDQLAHLKSTSPAARMSNAARRPTRPRWTPKADCGPRPARPRLPPACRTGCTKVAAASNGQLRSTAVVSEALDHGFRRVTVHFGIEGVLDTVQATLAAIQSARPAMFVDSLAIHATTSGDARNPPGLTMDVDVSGYMTAPGT
jgi:hypothetical protein